MKMCTFAKDINQCSHVLTFSFRQDDEERKKKEEERLRLEEEFKKKEEEERVRQEVQRYMFVNYQNFQLKYNFLCL